MDERKDNILTALKFTTETFKLLSTLLAVTVTLGLIGGFYALLSRLWGWLLVAVLLASASGVGLLIIRRDKKRFGKNKKYFRVKSLVVSLQLSNENDVEATRIERFKLISLVDDLTFFLDTIIWDGTGRIEYSTNTSGHTVHEHKSLVGHGYEVNFGRSLRKGEEVEVEVTCRMRDFGQTASCLLIKEIRYPTEQVALHVRLPSTKKPSSVVFQTLTSLTAHWSYDLEGDFEVDKDGTFQISSMIKRPVRARCYGLRWTIASAE